MDIIISSDLIGGRWYSRADESKPYYDNMDVITNITSVRNMGEELLSSYEFWKEFWEEKKLPGFPKYVRIKDNQCYLFLNESPLEELCIVIPGKDSLLWNHPNGKKYIVSYRIGLTNTTGEREFIDITSEVITSLCSKDKFTVMISAGYFNHEGKWYLDDTGSGPISSEPFNVTMTKEERDSIEKLARCKDSRYHEILEKINLMWISQNFYGEIEGYSIEFFPHLTISLEPKAIDLFANVSTSTTLGGEEIYEVNHPNGKKYKVIRDICDYWIEV